LGTRTANAGADDTVDPTTGAADVADGDAAMDERESAGAGAGGAAASGVACGTDGIAGASGGLPTLLGTVLGVVLGTALGALLADVASRTDGAVAMIRSYVCSDSSAVATRARTELPGCACVYLRDKWCAA